MKSITIRWIGQWLLIALMALLAYPAWAAPKIEHWTTPEGLRVYFVAAPTLPMLDLRLVFDAGGARDGDRPGMASFTNGILDQGADELNADQIAEAFESVGAIATNGTSLDMAWLALRTITLPEQQQKALDTWLKVLGKPTFPAKEFKNFQKLTLVSLAAEKQSPESIASKAFYSNLYGTHPYSIPKNGTEDSINSLTINDLKEFYQQYYVSKNAVLAIVGAVDRAQAEAIAQKIAAVLGQGEAAAPLAEVAALTEPKAVTVDFPSGQSHILVGQPGNKRGDDDFYVMYLGNHILGGGGFTSRLMQEVRNKRGLSYSVYSYFMPLAQLGPFQVGLQTKQDQTAEALQVVLDTLKKFQEEGPTETELSASKKDITGGFPLRTASNDDIVEYLGVIGFYGLPLDYLDTFTDKVNAITREQVIEVFKRRLQLDKMLTVVVGPSATAEAKEPKAEEASETKKPEQGENNNPSTTAPSKDQPTEPKADEAQPAS
ncbi:MAG: pitrilysin family protein [Thiofilum sp.]|uniref:M16 family metallopeptidase n=1 Tax=Thiofilum sp. TaxID=2212733 RepID=UPI0025E2D219|nr:pitrilysin family protein [Thiofilum sp.]MBK8451739.1 insulinase family protein [Thiofilum sp.]